MTDAGLGGGRLGVQFHFVASTTSNATSHLGSRITLLYCRRYVMVATRVVLVRLLIKESISIRRLMMCSRAVALSPFTIFQAHVGKSLISFNCTFVYRVADNMTQSRRC